MGFTFTPEPDTDRDIRLLERGVYDFAIKSATAKTSKSGNPMLELVLTVWGADGTEVSVYDYLLPKVAWKMRHFCEAIGADYESGDLDVEALPGMAGRAEIVIERQPDYPPKNRVSDYIPKMKAETKPDDAPSDLKDDDIPF